MLIPRFPVPRVCRRSSIRSAFFSCLVLTIAFTAAVVWQNSSRAARRQAPSAPQTLIQAAPQERLAGYRSTGGKHKLRVSDPRLAEELKRRGARLIAEYD